MKKVNAVIGLFSIVMLICHTMIMSYSMMTGWYNYRICKMLSRGTATFMIIHIALTLFMIIFIHEKNVLFNVKYNLRVLVQRISAVLIFLMFYIHMTAFKFIVNGNVPDLNEKIVLIVTEILFFAGVFSHAAVSFSRACISLGFISDKKHLNYIDIIAFIVCAMLFAVTSVILILFIAAYGGH